MVQGDLSSTRSPMEGRGYHFPSTCTHLHAHTHQLTCRGTDRPWAPQTHPHRRGNTHRDHDAIPLPDSETGLSPAQRHKHMRTYFSLVCHAKDKREESLVG